MKIGIIGAGQIGGTLTRRLAQLGHEVFVANSRGPSSLAGLAKETGAKAVTVREAARAGQLVVVTIPEAKIRDLPKNLFEGVSSDVVVIDTGNYYPRERDGRIDEIEAGMPESRWVEAQLGRPVVKAFNTMNYKKLLELGRPAGTPGRLALPVAGDDARAKQVVLQLVNELGFDGVDDGGLDDSWRQQPGTPVYDKELDSAGVRHALAEARKGRLPQWRAKGNTPGSFNLPETFTPGRSIMINNMRPNMKIVVIGGTGLIGSKVVAKLSEHGYHAVAASPASGVNTLTGEGVAGVLEGASVVVDVSNSPSFEDAAVMEFFKTSTGNLLGYEGAAGVGHHVALSIVGSDRLPDSGYLRAKIAQETLIRESSIPYSIIRATQFFEFMKGIADSATEGNTVRLPPVRFQPVAADDVASMVGKVAIGSPLNGIVELGGPDQFRFDEFIRRGLSAWKDPREVLADPNARYFGTELSEYSLVPGKDALLGETRFEDWLPRSANQSPPTSPQPTAVAAASKGATSPQ